MDNEYHNFWKVEYISCEGNHRWGIARTPKDWDADEVESNVPKGGMGGDIYKIIDVEECIPSQNYSWDLTD